MYSIRSRIFSVFRGSQAELGADMAYWGIQGDNDTHIVDERSVNAYSVRQRADSTYSDNVHTQHRAFTPHFRHMPYEFREALIFTSLTVYEGEAQEFDCLEAGSPVSTAGGPY